MMSSSNIDRPPRYNRERRIRNYFNIIYNIYGYSCGLRSFDRSFVLEMDDDFKTKKPICNEKINLCVYTKTRTRTRTKLKRDEEEN